MMSRGRRSRQLELTWEKRVETTVGVTAKLTVAVFMLHKKHTRTKQRELQRLSELRT